MKRRVLYLMERRWRMEENYMIKKLRRNKK
jgi:hypothetical protein